MNQEEVDMARNGLLIDYGKCIGCYTCEIACQEEHSYPEGKWGIKITEYALEAFDKVAIDYVPFTTDLCDLCARGIKAGESPACVQSCPAACIYYGTIADLAKQMEKKAKNVLYAPE
jgi:Fe-S-cluster-containing dehydrogenase component